MGPALGGRAAHSGVGVPALAQGRSVKAPLELPCVPTTAGARRGDLGVLSGGCEPARFLRVAWVLY